MKKNVNGIEIELTAQEEAAVLADWAANALKAAERKAAEKGASIFKAKVERQAQDLDAAGKELAALKLRLEHKLL